MRILPPLLLVCLACLALAGEATRAEQEARALAAVVALPDGAKREAGLKIVRGAWQRFREDAKTAEQPAAEGEPPRLAELRQRNSGIAALRTLAAEQGMAAMAGLVEAHLLRWPFDDEARAMLGLGRLAAGDHDGALRELIAVLALDPTGAAVGELRGRLFVDSDDEALAARAAADLAPLVARLLTAGCAAEAAGDVTGSGRALGELKPLLRAVRGPAAEGRLAALRAAEAERTEAWQQALEGWRAAATAGVTVPDPAPRLRALTRRLRAGEVDAAIAGSDATLLGELSPAFPERDDLQGRLFRLLLVRGQLGDVRRAALALLAAAPEHPLALLTADGAAAALDAKRVELLPPIVVRVRLAAPELGTRFPVVHGLDAALSEAGGDATGALAAIDRMLAAQPDDRAARWQRARLRLATGDNAGAIADCDTLIAAKPDDADTLSLRSRARGSAGDRAGAIADLDRLVVLRPGCATILSRARARRHLDDEAGTIADLNLLVETAKEKGDSVVLLDAADLTRDAALQRKLLEKASSLGNAEATLRLRRMR